jgi:L-cysteine:1D-myo-inositol 2-amino-2-deoxy-alpha-D-glucopyranoside ligase
MAIRLALLTHHYRSDWEWKPADLTSAVTLLGRLREAVAAPAGAPSEPVVEAVLAAMASDLDAPSAVSALREWADRSLGDHSEPGAGAAVARVADAALGLAL